jgi:hypothetical protein
MRLVVTGSETAGDNLRCREGKSPDLQIRCQNRAEVERKLYIIDSEDVSLEAAII